MFHDGCSGDIALAIAIGTSAPSLTRFQKVFSADIARARLPRMKPSVKTTAFIAPALVPERPSMNMRPSEIRRSRTPQVNAP
jgi:hypothetical protein